MIDRDQLMPEEQAEIDAAIAEADLGGGVPAEDVLRELRVRKIANSEPAALTSHFPFEMVSEISGTDDVISVPSDQDYDLTEEQEAFIEESIAEIERGEFVDGDEIIAELRRRAGLL